MSKLLVVQLKVDDLDVSVKLDDVLELLALQTNDKRFDDVWIIAFCRRIQPHVLRKICGSLGVPCNHMLCITRSVDAELGSRILSSAIAFLGGHRQIIVYDGNEDSLLGNIVPNPTNLQLAENGIFGYLQQLDDYHRRVRLCDILACLDGLLSDLEHLRSSPSQTVVLLIRPIVRFVRGLVSLLLRPPPCETDLGLGRYDSLSLVDFSADVARLRKFHDELSEHLVELDFVGPSMNFFRYGSRALGVLRASHPSRFRDIFPNVLSWWYAYHMAASKELSNLGYFSAAILHLARAFEAYALARLWELGHVQLKGRLQRPYLFDGRTEPGFDTLQRALSRIARQPGMELLYADLEDLRGFRNGNLLIHGFHLPDEATVRRARASVKGVVSRAETQRPFGVGLLGGAIGAFSSGENRRGDMGRVIAGALLRSFEPPFSPIAL